MDLEAERVIKVIESLANRPAERKALKTYAEAIKPRVDEFADLMCVGIRCDRCTFYHEKWGCIAVRLADINELTLRVLKETEKR